MENRLVVWTQVSKESEVYRKYVERVLTRQPSGLFTLDFFNDTSEATKALTGARGLITELGRRELFEQPYPAKNLIDKARVLKLPVAIISGAMDAERFVCPDAGGVLIEKTFPGETITDMLSAWVSSLVVSEQ